MLAGIARARRCGLDVPLVWAGQLSEAQMAHICARATQIGTGDALRLIGYVSDDQLAVLYRAALAHVLLSRFEGFGLTVVEAMACGCPVMTTPAGSLAEIAGDAAIIVEPEDHAAIGQGLVRLALDSAYRAGLVERGKARAPRFSLEIQAAAMASVYREFLQV
jgi:glycosyltransferase involved in cell wall biosynthesis